MANYNFSEFEPRWQKEWELKKTFATPQPSKDHPPYYILVMFPYPSGHLHMGHVRNYTIGDILARYYRRKGKAVLHPIGWDSFGLPAENAAVKNNVDPSKWTWENIAHMRMQLKQLGISYDWDREVATCHPDYYRWNQWIFIKMMEKGLVYRKKAPVNWCPTDKTVLANEQVHDGKCWRCDSEVVQKELKQWFFKITAYADQLIKDHAQLKPSGTKKGWPEKVLTMQKNWIGPSPGAYVDFKCKSEKIRVFTTRPDTLFGATFIVLAPEHPLVPKITTAEQKEKINSYKEKSTKLSKFDRTSESREKTGEFTGAMAVNPVNGKEIPIWIADYVLTDYGTGAIMAVPAHDERDFAFAQKFKIPVIQVIQNPDQPNNNPLKEAYTEDGVLINSGKYDGLSTDQAKDKISQDLLKSGEGEPTINYRLRDWLLSRQRFWGTPIPVVYCDSCGMKAVEEKSLPVKLPDNAKLTGEGESPLKHIPEWLNTHCPSCKGPATRETDTMDTFVDSSWYYARYTDAINDHLPFDKDKVEAWLPVTQYVGGIEHATMHLIYARFFHKVLRDMGMLTSDEPFGSLLTQGMVTLGGTAMSKSKGNVVDPSDVIKKYGVDSCRLFILFAAPPTQQLDWSDSQVGGVFRFLNRVWRVSNTFLDEEDAKVLKRSLEQTPNAILKEDLIRQTHVTIKRVTHDIEEDFGFNTAISAIMELVNAIYLYKDLGDSISKNAVEIVIQLLEPFAPHIAEELWSKWGHPTPLSLTPWPTYDENKMKVNNIQIVIQLNGKLKDKITVDAQANEDDVKSLALATLVNKGLKVQAKRVIYVPKKLVNFVEAR